MIDANGSRFHLLLGEADWARTRTPDGEPAFPPEESPPSDLPRQVQWNRGREEVTLWKHAFRFAASRGDAPVHLDGRRGAARDRFGTWYWIGADRRSILVSSPGSPGASVLWPVADACRPAPPPVEAAFRAVAQPTAPPHTLQGLAVTEDHYLVAGTLATDETSAGLLVFDLYSGGPPRHRRWPIAFDPFDLDQRAGGGVWVLDRANRRVWEIDARLEVVVSPPHVPAESAPPGPFRNRDTGPGDDPPPRPAIAAQQGWAVPAGDPIAIAAFPAGGVLVLERAGDGPFSRVHWLAAGAPVGAPASTRAMKRYVRDDEGQAPFTLLGHDFALGARSPEDSDWSIARLYVAGDEGNQAYAFGVGRQGDQLVLEPQPEYFPIRLFGGRGLVAADGEPWYDCGETWVKLVAQDRPRYADAGEIWTPVFDSGEPACVWHRLMLDACIPAGAGVEVYSRASDDWRDLTLISWLSEPERLALGAPDQPDRGDPVFASELADWRAEPSPRPRPDGSELPYLADDAGRGRLTWELLFQRARGRYLQVRLVLRGDGRSTPRLRALRAWYPRFSYLNQYLPAVYREDAVSADFLDRFLANFEGVFTTIEDRIAAAHLLFDVASAPADALEWLGRWFGVALDPSWDEARRRLFLRHAMDFFRVRGTVHGLRLAVRLAMDECVDDRLFSDAPHALRRAAPVRIIERFRTRRTPPPLLGEAGTAVPGPQRIDPALRWSPALGAAELHRRYAEALGDPPGTEFPLEASGDPSGWSAFAQRTLGFVPRASAADRTRWQRFLQRRHGTVAALNAAHGASWSSFDSVRLPADFPAAAGPLADWTEYAAADASRERRLWHDFLARRYRSVVALNAAWRTHWPGFDGIALPDRVPAEAAPLADWFVFEGVALAMHRTAHRFTVMVPVPVRLRTDTPAQQRRLALARTVLDLEKPAHTTYDMRFYWAMFRLGEARLGDDTLIDYGSRSPELMAPMVLGQGYLGEAFLAPHPGRHSSPRLEIGRDRVGRSARLGGP